MTPLVPLGPEALLAVRGLECPVSEFGRRCSFVIQVPVHAVTVSLTPRIPGVPALASQTTLDDEGRATSVSAADLSATELVLFDLGNPSRPVARQGRLRAAPDSLATLSTSLPLVLRGGELTVSPQATLYLTTGRPGDTGALVCAGDHELARTRYGDTGTVLVTVPATPGVPVEVSATFYADDEMDALQTASCRDGGLRPVALMQAGERWVWAHGASEPGRALAGLGRETRLRALAVNRRLGWLGAVGSFAPVLTQHGTTLSAPLVWPLVDIELRRELAEGGASAGRTRTQWVGPGGGRLTSDRMFELRTQWRGFDAAGAAVELPRGVGPMWARLIAGTGAGPYRYVGKFPLGGDLDEVQQILPAVPGLGPDDIRNFVLHVDAASQYPTFAGVLAGNPVDEYRPGFEDPDEESTWGSENAARLRPGRFVPLGQLKEVLWDAATAGESPLVDADRDGCPDAGRTTAAGLSTTVVPEITWECRQPGLPPVVRPHTNPPRGCFFAAEAAGRFPLPAGIRTASDALTATTLLRARAPICRSAATWSELTLTATPYAGGVTAGTTCASGERALVDAATGETVCLRHDLGDDPLLGGSDDRIVWQGALWEPDGHDLDGPREYTLTLSNCTPDATTDCTYSVVVSPETNQIFLKIDGENLRLLTPSDLLYLELTVAGDVLNPLWVFGVGVEALWQWVDGNGRPTNIVAAQNTRYRDSKSLRLTLNAPGDLGEIVMASVEVFDGQGNHVDPPSGYPPTAVDLPMRRSSNNPLDSDYNRYYADENWRVMLTERALDEIAAMEIPSDVVALYDPGTETRGRFHDDVRQSPMIASAVSFKEVVAEAILAEEAIFPRPQEWVFAEDGSSVKEMLDGDLYVAAKEARYWKANYEAPADVFRAIEYRYWPALGERRFSLRLSSSRFLDATGVWRFPRYFLVAKLGEGMTGSVSIRVDGQGHLLAPGGEPYKQELQFWADPRLNDHQWHEWRFSVDGEPDEPELLIVWQIEDERGVALAEAEAMPLWVMRNESVDGPDGDVLKWVKAGEDLLVAEGREASESKAVRALQRVLNDVLPRKRAYCADGQPQTVESRFPTFIDEDGFYTNGLRTIDLGVGLRRLAREFRKAVPDGQAFRCVAGGAMGVYEPGSSSTYAEVYDNPWIYQVDPTVREYVAAIYGKKAEDVDGLVVDRRLLVGDEELLFPHNTPLTPTDPRSVLDGVLELAHNVVERTMRWTLVEGERYAGLDSAEQTVLHGFSAVGPRPTDAWFARTKHGPASCAGMPAGCSEAKPHGRGMSYAYGVRQTIEQFNATVAACIPPDKLQAPMAYAGNLGADCQIGSGTGPWAGLLKDEYDFVGPAPQYGSQYWAGVECSGFVQNTLTTAVGEMGVGAAQLRPALFSTSTFMRNEDPKRAYKVLRYAVSTDGSSGLLANMRYARPGDLVFYDGHVSYFYGGPEDVIVDAEGPRAQCPRNADGTVGVCRYRVLHASGDNRTLPDLLGGRKFNRRVVVNSIGICENGGVCDDFYSTQRFTPTLSQPIGFGRIKLWD